MELETSPLTPEEQAIVEEETRLLVKTQSALTLQALPQQQQNYHEDILELRNSVSEVHNEDLPAILAHMERLVLLAQQQEKIAIDLPVNRLNPYFAHICLQEENRQRHVLIGNNHCMLEGLPHPIIDWKNAPLSRIYYRYQEGDEYEEDFEKRSLAGCLLTRRTLSMEQGLLQRIDTSSFSLIHTEQGWRRMESMQSHLQGGSGTAIRPIHLAKKENAGLGNRARRKDKFLQEITALIDPEQFEVITQPESGIVAIQGGAGSGKTTVALHRLAYLTALKPHYFIPARLLTIVFNKALSTYISKVLPALGVDSVQSWVYQNWTASFRRRFFPHLPNRYSDRTPVSVIEIKRHPVMLHWMKNQVQAHAEKFYQQLQKQLSAIPEKQRAFDAWEALHGQPLARRILFLRHWSEDRESIPRVGACRSYILQTRIQYLIDDLYPDLGKSLNSLAILIWEEAFLDQDQLEKTFQERDPHAFTSRQFKEVRDWAVQNFEQRHPTDSSLSEDLQESEPMLQMLDEEDDTLLLLLYQMTVGPFRGKKKKQIQYPHILVDEAQDFSPVELQLLLETTPQNRQSVTLAGDFDQQIMVGSPSENWSEMFRHLGLEETSVSTLKIGYRSTHEIIEIAKAIMGPMSVNQEWNAVRQGGAVELFKFQNHGHLINFLAEALIEVSVREPAASIALLTRYNAQADLIHEGLAQADVPQLRRVRDQDFSFAPGIEISDIAQVKGLEFDYVILLDVDEQTFPEDSKARHLLYVGVTRAAHQLWIMTCRKPSPLLPLDLLEAGN